MTTRDLEKKIEKIIERNCIEHPYEGTEVYKGNIKDEIMDLIKDIRRENLIVKEHDMVVLKDGREGAIVHVFKDGFFEVEFLNNKLESISIKDIEEII